MVTTNQYFYQDNISRWATNQGSRPPPGYKVWLYPAGFQPSIYELCVVPLYQEISRPSLKNFWLRP